MLAGYGRGEEQVCGYTRARSIVSCYVNASNAKSARVVGVGEYARLRAIAIAAQMFTQRRTTVMLNIVAKARVPRAVTGVRHLSR